MTYTTSLALRRAWLVDPLDPTTNPIVCGTTRPQERTDAQEGSVRQYAGGRRQAVVTPVRLVSIPLVLVGLSFAQWKTVEAWKTSGKVLLFRSVQGERHYVAIFELTVRTILATSMNDGRAFNVTVTLYEVDYDESV